MFSKVKHILLHCLQGNHGEDVKECYYYTDGVPSHSYMKALYKYPQVKFPYEDLLTQNEERSLEDPEYEITDTGKQVYFSLINV